MESEDVSSPIHGEESHETSQPVEESQSTDETTEVSQEEVSTSPNNSQQVEDSMPTTETKESESSAIDSVSKIPPIATTDDDDIALRTTESQSQSHIGEKFSIAFGGAGNSPKTVKDYHVYDSPTNSKWKFNLGNELTHGSVCLLPGEKIVETWKYESTALGMSEWIASICTFGIYYLFTRIFLQRKRTYTLHVTNFNVIVKEEMSETSFWCSSLLLENQATFPLKSLAFITAEEVGQKLFGLMPASVVLDLRFKSFPKQSEYPETSYHSLFYYIFTPFSIAAKAAMKQVFGIDVDAPPLKLAMQLAQGLAKMASVGNWILFAIAMGMDLARQAAEAIYEMMLTALLDPSVGPRQALGSVDACSFRLEVDVSEDPECVAKMRSIVKLLAKSMPERNTTTPSFKPRFNKRVETVAAGQKPKDINNKKTYETEDCYVILNDYLSLDENETIFDMCPCNPTMTSTDFKKVLCSLGLYYFTDLAGHLSHRNNMIFTNKRCMVHSVLVSSVGGACDHSRLDIWANDRFTDMVSTDIKGAISYRATGANFGPIYYPTNATASFMLYVLRSMFHPRYEVSQKLGLSKISREEFKTSDVFKKATMTSAALSTSEVIDVAVNSVQRLYSWQTWCCACGIIRVPKMTITCTNECSYIEEYTENWCSSNYRLLAVVPWCDVDGVYWQNFDTRGPPCAEQNATHHYDIFFGHKGATVSLCVRGDNSFRLGMVVPNRYYGVQDGTMNAFVDTINYRCLENDSHAALSRANSKSRSLTNASTTSTEVFSPLSNTMSERDGQGQQNQSPNVYHSPHSRSPLPPYGFPRTDDDSHECIALGPGEKIIKGWKLEAPNMHCLEYIIAFLTLGIYYLLFKIFCFKVKRFYNIYITNERVIIKEGLYQMRYSCYVRIFENQAAFKLTDLCYIRSQEVGERFCGLVPSLAQIELRFGRYPNNDEVSPSLDGSFPSRSEKPPMVHAFANAVKNVYGISENDNPIALIQHTMGNITHFKGLLELIKDGAFLAAATFVDLLKQLGQFILKLIYDSLFGKKEAVGVAQLEGEVDARSFVVEITSDNKSAVVAEIISLLSELVATRQAPLNPIGLSPLGKAKYTICPKNSLMEVNSTDKYGEEGAFVVVENLWKLLGDEVVYDVLPDNRTITCRDIIWTIYTMGLYYCITLRKLMQYKQSHMITNRRLISHTMRVKSGSLNYSSLEMWFLYPINCYTMIETKIKGNCFGCGKGVDLNFVTESSKFGSFQLPFKANQTFVKNYLKLIRSSDAIGSHGLTIMDRNHFSSKAELKQASFTNEFLTEEEDIDIAVGAKMPFTLVDKLLCRDTMTFTLTLTNKGLYVEAYNNTKRIFASIPWEKVGGMYWSNFQPHSSVCFWQNSPGYLYPLFGYAGSQVRLQVTGSKAFSTGVVLPGNFYKVDNAEVNALVDALAYRMALSNSFDVELN